MILVRCYNLVSFNLLQFFFRFKLVYSVLSSLQCKIIEKTSNNTSRPTRLDLMTLQLVLFLLLTVKYNKTLNFNHNINHITHLQDYSNFETLGTKHQLNLNSVCCTWAPIAGNSLSHDYLLSILTTLLNNTTNTSTNHLIIIRFQQFLEYVQDFHIKNFILHLIL